MLQIQYLLTRDNVEQEAQQTQEGYEKPVITLVEDPTPETPTEKMPPPERSMEDEPGSELMLVMRKAVLSKLEQNADLEGLSGAMNTIANSENGLSAEEIASWIQGFLEEKSPVLGIDQSQAETLSKEIVLIEQKFIEPLKLELSDSRAIKSVRESLYQLVLKNIISGEKICDIITSIKYKESPGEEAGDLNKISQDITGLYRDDGYNREIYIYGRFLKEGENAQRSIVNHEVGHILAESTNLFDPDQYARFQQFAQNPTDENIAQMQQENPQFAYLLRTIREPTSHLPMWNAYIKTRLKKLETISDPKELAQEREFVAKELVAEMISSYISASESDEAYFINQIKYSKPEDVIAYVKTLCGCKKDGQFAAFCQQNDLNLNSLQDGDTMQIIKELAKIPQLKIVFESSALWREMIASCFSDRGERLETKTNYVAISEIVDTEGFIGIDGEFLAGSYSGLQQTHSDTPNQPSSDNAFEKIWDFLTGKPSTEKTTGAK